MHFPPLIAQEGVPTSPRDGHPRLRPLFHCSPYQHFINNSPAPKKSTPPLSTAPTAQAQRNPGRRPGQNTNPAIPQDCLSGPRLSSTRTPTLTHHSLITKTTKAFVFSVLFVFFVIKTLTTGHWLPVPSAAGHKWMNDRNQDQLRR